MLAKRNDLHGEKYQIFEPDNKSKYNCNMNKNVITTLKSYFKQKPEVVAVYLFGSHAKGDEHRTSNIDIGILITEKLRTGASEKRIG
jgi:predicted nucleotidyltransferase